MSEDDQQVPPPHPLEIPFVWFALQMAEFVVVVLVGRALLPESIPPWLGWVITLVVFGGLTILNYRLRRRFIPR